MKEIKISLAEYSELELMALIKGFIYPGSLSIRISMKTILLIAFLFVGTFSFAQTAPQSSDSIFIETNSADTVLVSMSDLIEEMASSGLQKSESNYIKNRLTQHQIKSFNQIGYEIQNANSILKQGIDYARFTRDLNGIIRYKEVAIEGILINENKYLTIRSLTTTRILLNEILKRTENQLDEIRQNNFLLTAVQHKLDSLVADKRIYQVPQDSVDQMIYYQRLLSMSNDVGVLNVKLNNAIDSIQNLEILSKNFKFSLETDIVETNRLQKFKYDRFFISHYKIFTERNTEKISFTKSVIYSLSREILLLGFYCNNHWIKLLNLLILLVAITVYLKVLKNKYKKTGLYNKIKFPVQIFRHPIATATLVSITFYQFFLPVPPVLFTGILWFISGIALTIVFHKTENSFVFKTWMVFFLLYIFAFFDALILIYTITESWVILVLSVSALSFGIYTLYRRRNFENRAKKWIISGMIIMELCSIIFLLLGNYNTGKIFMVEGIFTVFVGYLLLNTFRLSKNIFAFSDFLKDSDEEKKLESLKDRSNNFSTSSVLFFLAGWLILITRNSYIYQRFAEPFVEVVSKKREIGEFAFTYEGVITFFVILFLSGFISKIVSFLADDKRVKTTGSKSSGLGSWLLLVRIAIITVGIIIAFRSAGFPMDRFTMIISALGVGIGFGMQTLVNNLISGLIIAFEKPINIEDIVEIGTKSGKMKSIGIRSSVLSTWDGSDVIIPNGDLLNQHIVNWTLGSNKRRSEIYVGVAYGTDLGLTKELIADLLAKNKQVLKNPVPEILFEKFNDSSIDILIRFWIGHFIYHNKIESELIMAIDKVFKENGIVIPFPQRDIHIQSKIEPATGEE